MTRPGATGLLSPSPRKGAKRSSRDRRDRARRPKKEFCKFLELFKHFVARHGEYGGEYLNECKKKVDNFNYREMKVGLAPLNMFVAFIFMELRG